MFTQQSKYNKTDVTKQKAECTLPVNTQGEQRQEQARVCPSSTEPLGEVNCIPECPQGPATPSHDPLDQVKTNELERDEAVVEVKQHKGIGEFDKVDEGNNKNYKAKEADERTLNAEYTLTINTCVKIKIPN